MRSRPPSPTAPRQLAREEVHLLACLGRSLGIVERLRLVQLVAQLLEPRPIRGLRLRVECRSGIAGAGGQLPDRRGPRRLGAEPASSREWISTPGLDEQRGEIAHALAVPDVDRASVRSARPTRRPRVASAQSPRRPARHPRALPRSRSRRHVAELERASHSARSTILSIPSSSAISRASVRSCERTRGVARAVARDEHCGLVDADQRHERRRVLRVEAARAASKCRCRGVPVSRRRGHDAEVTRDRPVEHALGRDDVAALEGKQQLVQGRGAIARLRDGRTPRRAAPSCSASRCSAAGCAKPLLVQPLELPARLGLSPELAIDARERGAPADDAGRGVGEAPHQLLDLADPSLRPAQHRQLRARRAAATIRSSSASPTLAASAFHCSASA